MTTETRTVAIERDALRDAEAYLAQALRSRSNDITRAKRDVARLKCVKAMVEGWRWA